MFSISLLFYVALIFLVSFFFNETMTIRYDSFARMDINTELYFNLYRMLIAAIAQYTIGDIQWLIIII